MREGRAASLWPDPGVEAAAGIRPAFVTGEDEATGVFYQPIVGSSAGGGMWVPEPSRKIGRVSRQTHRVVASCPYSTDALSSNRAAAGADGTAKWFRMLPVRGGNISDRSVNDGGEPGLSAPARYNHHPVRHVRCVTNLARPSRSRWSGHLERPEGKTLRLGLGAEEYRAEFALAHATDIEFVAGMLVAQGVDMRVEDEDIAYEAAIAVLGGQLRDGKE